MIQHQINHDACYRDIQPHRQGDASNALVSLEVASHGAPHGNDHKGDDHRRQDRLREQNPKIDGSRNPLSGEAGDSMMRVIGEIRDEKDHRRGQRGDLTIPMRLNVFAPDKKVTAG